MIKKRVYYDKGRAHIGLRSTATPEQTSTCLLRTSLLGRIRHLQPRRRSLLLDRVTLRRIVARCKVCEIEDDASTASSAPVAKEGRRREGDSRKPLGEHAEQIFDCGEALRESLRSVIFS
jgi:hypothetical protein